MMLRLKRWIVKTVVVWCYMANDCHHNSSLCSVYKSGWVPSNLERYERFWSALVHGEDWSVGLKYFALYWLTFRRGNSKQHFPMFENDSKHAEEHLLEHLNVLLPNIQENITEINIMQSASPCFTVVVICMRRCSMRYIEQLGDIKEKFGVKVTITFSSLHKIQRQSCKNDRHAHVNDVDVTLSDRNAIGLKKLRNAGFELRITGFRNWCELRTALQLPPTYSPAAYHLSARKLEDVKLLEDLKMILRSYITSR